MIVTEPTMPTVVLIHGAFADASGFSGIIRELATAGYDVVAPPNPLRSLAFDAAAIGKVVRAVPLSLAALTEKATAAGWRAHPCWYLVCEQDNAIPPDAERFMAERMKATTDSIRGSHAAFIAQPVRVARFIKKTLAS